VAIARPWPSTALPLDPTIVYSAYGTRENGLKGVQKVLDAANPPTAAVCFNDLAAFGAMLGLRHRGLEAGSDFSLIGCDDVQEAAQWYPGLTTIKNFQDEMGRRDRGDADQPDRRSVGAAAARRADAGAGGARDHGAAEGAALKLDQASLSGLRFSAR
jgi:hypothetical protein